jgi:hypothetical protein
MEKGNDKNAVLLTVIGIATLLVAIVGATFAYFTAQVNYTDSASTLFIKAASGGTATFTGGDPITLTGIYPRSNAWAERYIVVHFSNSSTNNNWEYALDLEYKNELTGTANTINFLLERVTTTGDYGTPTAAVSGDTTIVTASSTSATSSGRRAIPTNATDSYAEIHLADGVMAPTNGGINLTHIYKLSVFFDNQTDANQNANQNKSVDLYVKITDKNIL